MSNITGRRQPSSISDHVASGGNGFFSLFNKEYVWRYHNLVRPNYIQISIWGLIVAVAVLLYLIKFNSYQVGTTFDDAQYAVLAQSLAHFPEYGLINAPGQPATSQFPFGYPLLLAPWLQLFPSSFQALKIPSLLSTILVIAILFWGWPVLSRGQSYWWGLAAAALYAFSPMTVGHASRIMAEPVFTTFCFIALYLSERQAAAEKYGRGRGLYLSLAMFFALFTRTIGIILIASIFLYVWAVRKRRRWHEWLLVFTQISLLVVMTVAFTPIKITDLIPSGYLQDRFLVTSFSGEAPNRAEEVSLPTVNSEPALIHQGLRQIPLILGSVYDVATRYFKEDIRYIAVPVGGAESEQNLADRLGLPSLPLILGIAISFLVLLGWYRLCTQYGISSMALFGMIYLISLFFWRGDDVRLLYPIQPQIIIGLVVALGFTASSIAKMMLHLPQDLVQRGVVATCAITLIGASVWASLQIDDSRVHAGDLQQRTSWLRVYTPSTAVVMTEAPQADYLYSGRKTIPFPDASQFTSAQQFGDHLANNGVTHILFAPAIRWGPVFENEYTDNAFQILDLLATWGKVNPVERIYADQTTLIFVFQVQP